MGIVHLGAPTEFIGQLAAEFAIKNFVETGTYYGKTALWASSIFEKVITIEYSKEIQESNSRTYKATNNISFLFGDSRLLLKDIVPSLKEPAIFWLDSHWSGGETYGEDDQCPLIEELITINQSPLEHLILIDDARLFTAPPPLPNRLEQWPTIKEVIEALGSTKKDYYVAIIEDVIIASPSFAKEFVAKYCQTFTTKMWQTDSQRIIKMWQEYSSSGNSSTQVKTKNEKLNRARGYVKRVLAKILHAG